MSFATQDNMRVLVVHNSYQRRGGEDAVVESEMGLLRAFGNEVEIYHRSNDEVAGESMTTLALQTIWSLRTTAEMDALIKRFRPAVIHAHNTFPLISPALYWVVARVGIPVVQTLHNFRLMCLNALFLRDGQLCEDCLGQVPWRGVVRKCYRGSGAASAVLAGTLTLHRGLGTYRNKVARYIALNDFCRNKFIAGGLPAERIVVKPNFVDFPAPEVVARQGMLFVGRLSVEKGVATMGRAAALLHDARLRVAGDGPEAALLDDVGGVTLLGSLSKEAVRREMNSAVALVVPSICYETFGLVIVEAFACGTPVIASRIGVLPDLVRDGETGLLFEPGNSRDLADKMGWALAHSQEMAVMGRKAREQYEAEYSAEVNYQRLMAIYQEAIAEAESHNG